ncbi:MAG TPA: trehalose-phosphatase [Candidatus Binatia bacterium]
MPQRLNFDSGKLWRQVVRAPAIMTFLDFDGTLVEIAPTPADVDFAAPRKRWLEDILSLPCCSVGVVSGRPIDELRRIIGLDEIFYIGCHGLEWAAPDGARYTASPSRVLVDALSSLRAEMREAMAGFAGVVVEDKGISLALHYRLAERDTAWAARKEFVRAVNGYQQQGVKLELLPGKEVIEAKPAGTTKGDAVSEIWARYAPTALPIYIGDDVTDESAFSAVGETGLAIVVAETPRTTAARLFLKNPTEVYVFLRCLTHLREKVERH